MSNINVQQKGADIKDYIPNAVKNFGERRIKRLKELPFADRITNNLVKNEKWRRYIPIDDKETRKLRHEKEETEIEIARIKEKIAYLEKSIEQNDYGGYMNYITGMNKENVREAQKEEKQYLENILARKKNVLRHLEDVLNTRYRVEGRNGLKLRYIHEEERIEKLKRELEYLEYTQSVNDHTQFEKRIPSFILKNKTEEEKQKLLKEYHEKAIQERRNIIGKLESMLGQLHQQIIQKEGSPYDPRKKSYLDKPVSRSRKYLTNADKRKVDLEKKRKEIWCSHVYDLDNTQIRERETYQWFRCFLMTFFFSQEMREMIKDKIYLYDQKNRGMMNNSARGDMGAKKEFHTLVKELIDVVPSLDVLDQTQNNKDLYFKLYKISPSYLYLILQKIDPDLFKQSNKTYIDYIQYICKALDIKIVYFFHFPDMKKIFLRTRLGNESFQTSEMKNMQYILNRENADVVMVTHTRGYTSRFTEEVKGISEALVKSDSDFMSSYHFSLKDEILNINERTYKKDAVLYNNIDSSIGNREIEKNRMISGLTCQGKSYIFNEWIKKESQEKILPTDKDNILRKALPCELMRFNWKNPVHNEYTIESENCNLIGGNNISFPLHQYPQNILYVYRNSKDSKDSRDNYSIDQSMNSKPSPSPVVNSVRNKKNSLSIPSSLKKNSIKTTSVSLNPPRFNNTNDKNTENIESGEYEKYIKHLSDGQAQCIKRITNWSKLDNMYRFDSKSFKPDKLKENLSILSPKMAELLKKIEELDEKDMQQYGHTFKHVIFSDVKRGYGGKIITSALIATKNRELAFHENLKIKNKREKDQVAILTKSPLFNRNIPPKYFIEEVKQTFNKRPDNIHGEHIRFLVLESEFKEGIDLHDVRHLHIFEPQESESTFKQIQGRAIRTCSHKGLKFHPSLGWPLYIFIYHLRLPEPFSTQFNVETMHDMYIKSKNIDLSLYNFMDELVKHCIMGSVDYHINKELHTFRPTEATSMLEFPEDGMIYFKGNVNQSGSGPIKFMRNLVKNKKKNISLGVNKRTKISKKKQEKDNKWNLQKEKIKQIQQREEERDKFYIKKPLSAYTNQHPFINIRAYVKDNFMHFAERNLEFRNECNREENKKLKPIQEFIRRYFIPDIDIKGLLLYHSTGTGKTCTAVATASTEFQRRGYTILWVTRNELRKDLYKNIFGLDNNIVCHMGLRNKLEAGEIKPVGSNISAIEKKKLLGYPWHIEPITYKQFSNLLRGGNQYYHDLVERNGKDDILRKTLVIIDEAQKLYGDWDDLDVQERPDTQTIYNSVMESYRKSGKESVRLLLMSATPFKNDPMQLIQLINLCKHAKEGMPSHFDLFAKTYLDEDYKFTPEGARTFLDNIAGHISYLNKERDVREFAQPIVNHVYAEMSVSELKENKKKYERSVQKYKIIREYWWEKLKELDENLKNLRGAMVGSDGKVLSYIKEEIRKIQEKKDIVIKNVRDLEENIKQYRKEVVVPAKNGEKADLSQEDALFSQCLKKKT